MALEVLCSSFFGRHLFLDVALDPQYNMKQYNKIHFIQISNILLQDSEICWRKMFCIGFGPSHDVLQELLEVEKCWRRLEGEETNSHERSTWRLSTPTICRRSVPTKCNAGLPKKKILQPGKINRKTNQIVLVSTMPSQSILSCYLMKDYL